MRESVPEGVSTEERNGLTFAEEIVADGTG